ncbi:MAG: Mbeg1-like protein [Bifidobacterium sp.]|uniref:Mbeg1-like protein n=1 Tax=Bifidobacterium sp. TaxID=41200 RepID=UPI003F0F1434
MGNIVDYVRTDFRTFAEHPFSAVDSLVLSELSYIRLPLVVPVFGAARSIDTIPLTGLLRAEDFPMMFAADSQQVNSTRLDLLVAVAESPRFRGLRVGEYIQRDDADREQQFAAMTFDLGDCTGIRGSFGPGGLLYVAFRGTDGTLLGWKEDFNMAFRCPVPSQESAAKYLSSILDRSAGVPGGDAPAVMVGGHSKGGNMAVYASVRMAARDLDAMQWLADESGESQLPMIEATSMVGRRTSDKPSHTSGANTGDVGNISQDSRGGQSNQDDQNSESLPTDSTTQHVQPAQRNRYAARIRRVFSHDGPGFPKRLESAAFDAVASRVDKTVPQSSVVGMLMDDGLPHRVIEADAVGIMQHLGMSWQVEDGEFVAAPGLSATAMFAGSTVNAWMLGIDPADRRKVIDELYVIFSTPGYRSFGELAEHWTTALPVIIDAARKTDRETRRLVAGVLAALPATAWRNLPQVPQLVIDSLR